MPVEAKIALPPAFKIKYKKTIKTSMLQEITSFYQKKGRKFPLFHKEPDMFESFFSTLTIILLKKY